VRRLQRTSAPCQHNAPQPPLPQQRPGEEVWRLRDTETGRLQTCELRDNSRAGAGWDVWVLMDGEPLFSRRRGDEAKARYVANAMKGDNMRGGDWVENDRQAEGS